MTDKEIIVLVQEYKIRTNDKLFKSSSDEVRKGTLERAHNEKKALLDLSNTQSLQITDEVLDRDNGGSTIKLLEAAFNIIQDKAS